METILFKKQMRTLKNAFVLLAFCAFWGVEAEAQVNALNQLEFQVDGDTKAVINASGNISSATPPTAANHLTNKAYVDSRVASAGGGGNSGENLSIKFTKNNYVVLNSGGVPAMNDFCHAEYAGYAWCRKEELDQFGVEGRLSPVGQFSGGVAGYFHDGHSISRNCNNYTTTSSGWSVGLLNISSIGWSLTTSVCTYLANAHQLACCKAPD